MVEPSQDAYRSPLLLVLACMFMVVVGLSVVQGVGIGKSLLEKWVGYEEVNVLIRVGCGGEEVWDGIDDG